MLDAIKQGDAIPLVVQLFNGVTDRVVKATLIKPDGTTYASAVTLPHVSTGLYKNSSQLMPLVDYIIATYTIYDDTGLVEDTVYARGSDTFYRSKEEDPSELVGTLEDQNMIVGSVEDLNEITGGVEE
jgi:hypothetical protein